MSNITKRVFSFIRSLIRPHSKTMTWGLVFLISVNILLLIFPYLFSQIIDFIIEEVAEEQGFSLRSRSTMYALGLFILSLLIFFLRLGWRNFLIMPSFKIENTLKKQLFSHFLRFNQETQRSISTGEQVSIVERETNQLTSAISWGTLALADGLFTVISVYSVLIIWYRDIAWASLLVYPSTLIYVYFLFRRLSIEYEKIEARIAGISELTREMFENIATIQSQNSENFYQNKFFLRGKGIIRSQMRISFLTSMLWPMLIFVNGLSLLLCLYLGITAYQSGTASIGDIFAVIGYIVQVELPFLGLGFAFDIQQKGLSSVKRVHRALNLQPSPTTATKQSELQKPSFNGKLEVRNLSFFYSTPDKYDATKFMHEDAGHTAKNKTQQRTDDTQAEITSQHDTNERFKLGPLSFQMNAGQWLGITGRIGSGKSTLIKVIAGIYTSDVQGDILWDGVPIQEIDVEHFRSQVLYQAQNFHLFSISIAKNIVFTDDELNITKKNRAKRFGNYSALKDDVRILPEKWDTQIGAAGILLSGGQKQRVSLARTLYAQTPILILDDIFSGLDNKTSKQILTNLTELRREKSTIIISNNLPIISNTDFILVMDNGKIIEEGTHAALLKQNSTYTQNWKEYLIDKGEYYE